MAAERILTSATDGRRDEYGEAQREERGDKRQEKAARRGKTARETPVYTLGEELFSAISHGLGALLAAVGTALLLLRAADAWQVVSGAIYGAMLILLFTMSCLYHSFTGPRVKRVFRVFDHSSVALLIAGTYTPFTLVTLRGWVGWTLFGVVWAATVVSVVFSAISIEKFKVPCMVCYLASGWCVILALPLLLKAMPWPGIWLLIGGGVAYTLGTLFYRSKTRYMHAIWHVFVLAGAALHYACIYGYVIG